MLGRHVLRRRLTTAMVCAAIASAMLPAAVPARAETITLVADEWCPYNCAPGADKPGFLIEIAQRVFEPAGLRVEYRIVPWARAIRDTRAGRYSAILGAIPSEAPDFVYPEGTGFRAGTHAFVARGSTWAYGGLDSLDAVTIGVILDYSYGDEVDAYLARHRASADRVHVSTGEDALEKNVAKLRQGRISVVLEDPAVMRFFLERTGQADAVVPAGILEDTEVFIAFGPNEEHAVEHAKMLEDGMQKLRASGELAQILAGYGLTAAPGARGNAPSSR